MKKKLLLLLSLFSLTRGIHAQCSTTYPVANNCTTFGDVISHFELNGIAATGNTGCSTNGYGLFATPVWNLQPGGTYTFAATIGVGTDDEGLGIWIDLNNDGFYAVSEMVYAAGTPAPTQNGSFTIPISATIANNLHMRVMAGYQWVFTGGDACIDYVSTWGETEDHYVNIVCPSPAGLTIAASNTLVCAGNTVAITAGGFASYNWTGGITNGVAFSPSATQDYTLTAISPGNGACPSVTTTAVKSISVTSTPLVINAVSSSPSICAGTSATLTGSGAASYTWMPGNSTTSVITVSPGASMIYTLTGANPTGCPGTKTLSLPVQAAPTLTIAASGTLICSGDQANLTITGTGLTFTWNPGGSNAPSIAVSPVNTTAYTATVTNAAGCRSTATKVIAVNQNPVISIAASDPTVCANGSSTLSAYGANGTYSWSTNDNTPTIVVNPAHSTLYTVTGTNLNTCHSSTVITVEVFEPVLSVSSDTAICLGSNVTIGASGADSYVWETNGSTAQNISVSPSATTTYSVSGMVTENGLSCTATNTILVAVNELPAIIASSSQPTICSGKSASLTANGAGATGTYTWSSALGNTPVIVVSPILNQTYSVTGTDANGCRKTTSVSVAVSPCVGIESIGANNLSLLIYPNPNSGEFTISAEQNISLQIINELGQLVKTITLTALTPDAKISNLANGVYFISGKNENGSVNQKIVVAK